MNTDGDHSSGRDDASALGGDEDDFKTWWLTRDQKVEDEPEDDIWYGAVYAAFDDSAFPDSAVYAEAPDEIRGLDPDEDVAQPDGLNPSDAGFDESVAVEDERNPYEQLSPETSIDHWSVDDLPVEDEGGDLDAP